MTKRVRIECTLETLDDACDIQAVANALLKYLINEANRMHGVHAMPYGPLWHSVIKLHVFDKTSPG